MKYRKKIVRVQAVQLKSRIIVPDGTTDWVGLPSDWLLVHDDGRQEIKTDEAFKREYEAEPVAPAFNPNTLPGIGTQPYTPPVRPVWRDQSAPRIGDVWCQQ